MFFALLFSLSIECPANCDICSDETTCTKCYSSYGLNSEGVCVRCPSNCQCERSDQCTCTQGSGKFFDANGNPTGLCASCPYSCKNCSENSEICTECISHYGLVLDKNGINTGKCELCVSGCEECSDDYTKCTKCKEGFGMVLNEKNEPTGKCSLCQPFCAECYDNYKECDLCFESFVYVESNDNKPGKCVSCPKGCFECDKDLKCLDDADTQTKVKKQKTIKKQSRKNKKENDQPCHENCISCTNSICDKCKEGFLLVNGECQLPTLKRTITAEEDGTDYSYNCNYNQGNVIIDGKPTDQCGPCPELCNDCFKDNSKCSVCNYNAGFIIKDGINTGKCELCEEGCRSCRSNSKICTSCDSGYGPVLGPDGKPTGKCAECPDNCFLCPLDHTICTECSESYGFQHVNGQKTNKCERCTTGCISCKDDNSFCTECDKFDDFGNPFAFYLDENGNYNGKCARCSPGCAECTYSDYCDICDEGYGAIKNDNLITNQCSRCSFEYCGNCNIDKSKCIDCLSGFIKDENNKCVSCQPGCEKCESTTKCQTCKDGYEKDGDKCIKCSDFCDYCYDKDTCSTCSDGYGVINGKCQKCQVENCYDCDGDVEYCSRCDEGFYQEKGKCVPCKITNCGDCEEDPSGCYECKTGFYLNDEETKCLPCISNCIYCDRADDCDICDDGYYFETLPSSSNYHKCVPYKSDDCNVEGCLECVSGNSNQCKKCISSYEIDINYQCIKKVEEIDRVTYEEYYDYTHNYVENSKQFTMNVDSVNLEENVQCTVPHTDQTKEIKSVEITNNKNKNVAIKITSITSDITVSITGSQNFDIKFTNESPLKSSVTLDSSLRPNIKEGKGVLTVKGKPPITTVVNMNLVEPSVDGFTIAPDKNLKIVINEVSFNDEQEMKVESTDNSQVEINTIKLVQGSRGKITSSTIKEKINLGVRASLEIDKTVNLAGSIIDIPYNVEYGQVRAPIFGVINKGSNPKEIIISDRSLGDLLEDKEEEKNVRIVIAQSTEKFDCDAWKDKVTNKASNEKLRKFECVEEDNVFRLVASEKDKEKNKLSAGAIAGIVIAVVVVVGVVIFLCVYFLVIKKKSKDGSSGEAADDNEGNEEV